MWTPLGMNAETILTNDTANGSAVTPPTLPYSMGSVALHWLSAAMMAGILILAWVMTALPDQAPNKIALYRLHKSLGLTVLLFAVIRLWLRYHRRNASLRETSPIERIIKSTTHALIYIALLLMPVSGFIMSSAGGHPVAIWAIPLPAMMPNAALAYRAEQVHAAAQWGVYILILLHLLGVIWHVWFRRDGLLDDMLPPQRPGMRMHD